MLLYDLQLSIKLFQRSSTKRAEENKCPETTCPLAAKDSEWVDILQTPSTGSEETPTSVFDEEEVLQLVNFVYMTHAMPQLSHRGAIFHHHFSQ